MLAEALQKILDLTQALQAHWQAEAEPEKISALLDEREACIHELLAQAHAPEALADQTILALQQQVQLETGHLLQMLQQNQAMLRQDQHQLQQTRSAFAAYEASELPQAHFIERET